MIIMIKLVRMHSQLLQKCMLMRRGSRQLKGKRDDLLLESTRLKSGNTTNGVAHICTEHKMQNTCLMRDVRKGRLILNMTDSFAFGRTCRSTRYGVRPPEFSKLISSITIENIETVDFFRGKGGDDRTQKNGVATFRTPFIGNMG